MATTTNYGWTTPNDTDLVKDGAAAIRTLGSSIDTTVFANASASIAKTIVDAKGDIIAATAADTVSRLAVGANDTVLTADSTTATGLKWAAPAGGGANYTLLNAGGTNLTGAQQITVSGISGKDKIFIVLTEASSADASSTLQLRLNADTGSNYNYFGLRMEVGTTFDKNITSYAYAGSGNDTGFTIATLATAAGSVVVAAINIEGCNSSGVKIINNTSGATQSSGAFSNPQVTGGIYTGTSAISSITIRSTSGNLDAGKVFVYTSA